MEIKYHAKVFPLPASMIYFRSDSTYVLCYCDNQISEAGRFQQFKDSILLTNRFNVKDKKTMANGVIFIDTLNKILFYSYTEQINNIETNKIIPFKHNLNWAHIGILRGQNISIDSIINNYQIRSIEEQEICTDSGLSASFETFLLYLKCWLLIKVSAKNPAHRQYAAR